MGLASAAIFASRANDAGDATLLPLEMQGAVHSEVERAFGPEFATALKSLPVGGWEGPVKSAFGLHLVQISDKGGGHAPLLEQVRAQVERDLLQARTEQANEAIYEKLRANYRVRVESRAPPADPAG